MLAILTQQEGTALPVELVMHVSRGDDNRLTGNVRTARDPEAREFSGMLELMRVFEDLVPDRPPPASTHMPPVAINSRTVGSRCLVMRGLRQLSSIRVSESVSGSSSQRRDRGATAEPDRELEPVA